MLFQLLVVLLVSQQLTQIERRQSRLDHHVGLEVKDAFDVPQGHVEQQADARRQGLQEPDVRDGTGQFDVAHALAAHLGQRDLDATLLADDTAMLQTLVLAAQALVVLDRSENPGAEQPVPFRLERAVVDGLGLLHFAKRPRTDHFRGRKADAQRVKLVNVALLFQ